MGHYFTNDNLKSAETKVKVKIKDKAYTFITDIGVFSKKGLDFGTRTLLESIPNIKGDILDLGCGYGPIGIYLASMANVDMVDVNKRSLNLAKKNALLNNVKVNIFESNIYEKINKKYDYIVTNPPIKAGKNVLYSFVFEATNYLKENGELWLVINKNSGAKSLIKKMEDKYITKIITKNKGFYVIMAKKHWQVAYKHL